MKPEMRRKFWGILVICFAVEGCVGYFLADPWKGYELAKVGRFLYSTGALGLLVSLVGFFSTMRQCCPNCGAVIQGGKYAKRELGDRERGMVRCPNCGTIFKM